MKLTISTFLFVVFISSWVLGDIAQASYGEKLYWSIATTVCFAYMENAHTLCLNSIKNNFLKWKSL